MEVVGSGYYKARNADGQSCEMRLHVGWGKDEVSLIISENRPYLEGNDTRAENNIVLTPDDAKKLAEEIMKWLAMTGKLKLG